jgi:uncharacterized protein
MERSQTQGQATSIFARYLVLAFTISWSLWLLIVWTGQAISFDPLGAALPLAVAGDLGPLVAAIACVAIAGRGLWRELFRRCVQWRFGVGWYVVALSLVPLVYLSANLLHVWRGGQPPAVWLRYPPEGWLLAIAAPALFAFEQVGWRGIAQPYLQQRLGAIGASLALGCIWATWHLPLFAIPGSGQHGQSISNYFFTVTAWSFVMTLLWSRTRGSVFACWLFHFAINAAWSVVPTAPGSLPMINLVYGVMIVLVLPLLPRAPVVATGTPRVDPARP